MNDRIELTGLSAFGRHGVLDFEKKIPQPFLLDIALEVDLLPAGQSDDLAVSLSYADVASRAIAVCAGESVDLIETLAERVADACLTWDCVEAVEVTVRKPHAPAGVEFVAVGGKSGPAVSIRREREREVVIALGTNRGRRVVTLASALDALRLIDGLKVVHVSPIVETDPVGGPQQPDYLNAVVVGETRLSGAHLMRELHRIERLHGRRREVRWGARTLDLDLIQLGTPGSEDEVRCGDSSNRGNPDSAAGAVTAGEPSPLPLTLPHPRATQRAFVMLPWALAVPWAQARCGDQVRLVTDLVRELDVRGVRLGPAWSDVEHSLEVPDLVPANQSVSHGGTEAEDGTKEGNDAEFEQGSA